MTPSELLMLRRSLQALAVDYWDEVDFKGGSAAPAYYTDDATFATSVREYNGRAEIEAFYGRRRGRGARVSLHVMHNFRIEPQPDDAEVHCHYMLSLFAADGEPVLPSRPPIMVATVHEVVRRQPDGAWRYRSRRVRPLFRDGTPTTG